MPRLYEGYETTAWLVTQFDLLGGGRGMFGLARALGLPEIGKVTGLRAPCRRIAQISHR
jgi:hypothetical protein